MSSKNPDVDTSQMKRVAVVGSSGAGKSTLSRELSRILDIPVIHLDVHYWQAGWTETPEQVWLERQKALLEGESWIVDGHFGSTLDLRLEAADTVIFLDFSRFLCTYRVLKRLAMYQKGTRPDMADGCDERFNWDFMKFVWTFSEQHRPRVLERLDAHRSTITVHHFKSPGELREFLRDLRTSTLQR